MLELKNIDKSYKFIKYKYYLYYTIFLAFCQSIYTHSSGRWSPVLALAQIFLQIFSPKTLHSGLEMSV